MKIGASVELVWQLAGQEAIAAEFKEILTEHFFAALLKFSELPLEEVEKIGAGAEVVKAITADIVAVREEVESRSIDSTRVRRELRSVLGRGGSPYDGGQMHRSQAARDMCDAAARLADDSGGDTLMARHLFQAILAAATPAINRVLGDAASAKAVKRSKTPLLDECGEDLSRLAADGKLLPVPGRQAECKAVGAALGRRDCSVVLLATESDAAAREVAGAMAHAAAQKDAPAALKGARIVDVTGVSAGADTLESLQRLQNVLAEAGSAGNVILFVPGIEAPPDAKKPGDWAGILQAAAVKGSPRCICRIAPEACRRWAQKDPVWKRMAQAIWIREERQNDVPIEL